MFLIGGDIWKTIWNFSLFSFFLEGNLSVWFVAAILVLYILFPLIFSISKHDNVALLVVILIWLIALGNAFLLNEGVLHKLNEIFFVRVPIFILGAVVARKEQEGSINLRIGTRLLFLIWIGMVLLSYSCIIRQGSNYWTIVRILFCPISLLFCVGISNLPIGEKTRIYKIINNLGGITLEIYLLHERILYWTHVIIAKIIQEPVIESKVSNIIAVIISVVTAYYVSKILTFVLNFFKDNILSVR